MSEVSNRQYMVTGATGLLGTHVLRSLARVVDASRIVIASRTKPEALTHGGETSRWSTLDLGDPGLSVPAGLDTVIHVAGEKSNRTMMEAVNHHGTRRLAQACTRAGVRRFIHVSSVGVYGVAPHAGLVDEACTHRPRNGYEVSKNAGESEVRATCLGAGMECVVVQPSNVLGHVTGRRYPLLGLMGSIKTGRFAYFGAKVARVNYVSVEDVAAAVVAAAHRGPDGAIYIVNTAASLVDLVGWIADELGVDAPRTRLPQWVGAFAATAAGVVERLARRPIPFDRDRYLELTNTTEYDGRAIERELGLRYPLGIERCVRALVRAYHAEGRL